MHAVQYWFFLNRTAFYEELISKRCIACTLFHVYLYLLLISYTRIFSFGRGYSTVALFCENGEETKRYTILKIKCMILHNCQKYIKWEIVTGKKYLECI